MANNKAFGPALTLIAVATLGGGIWLMNVSQAPAPAAPTTPVTQSAAAAAAPAPPAVEFPANADYVGKIPTRYGVITLEVTVDGQQATAYACDGDSIEVWLRGPAANGKLALWSKDRSSRLDGELDGTAIAGTLAIGQRSWDFTAAPVVGADDVN